MEVMSRKDAIIRGVVRYYTGMACKKGHVAARYTSNNMCVDCLGKVPRKTPLVTPDQKADKLRQKLVGAMDLWSETTPAAELPAKVDNFVWTEEARQKLIDAYIDTGDLAGARDRIGVTPSQYSRELEHNPLFADQMKAASIKAFQALEEKAIQMALGGNDKLLSLVLKAKLPGYHEKVEVNTTTVVRAVSDEQLNRKLGLLLAKHRDIIDVEIVADDTAGKGELASPFGGAGTSGDPEPIQAPVSEDWLSI